MSRLRLFLKNVAAGYVLIATNVLYSLVSVPVTLHFLTPEQFGLWNLLYQLTNYLVLIDFGISPAMGRLLIEHKDHPQQGRYGALIQTGLLVGTAQGLAVMAVGLAGAGWFASFFDIPAGLRSAFVTLVWWQVSITGVSFFTRTFRHVLYAHQRNDIINSLQAAGFVLSLAALWISLRAGAGLFSVVWAVAVATTVLWGGALFFCVRLRLLPPAGCWGRPTWPLFKELFRFGSGVFLLHLGSLLIGASQSVLLSRGLGLGAVAAWSVGTKVFLLLGSLIYVIYDNSAAALSEMMARHEPARLRSRYLDLLSVSLTAAAAAAVVYAACNALFVEVWTSGKIAWSPLHDVLLGLWLLVLVLVHANSGFVVLTKQIRLMPLWYLVEGVVFVAAASLTLRHGGLPAMILASLVCSALFTGAYGVHRIREYFALSSRELLQSLVWRLVPGLALLVPYTAVVCLLTAGRHGWPGLLLRSGALLPGAALVFLRCGLPPALAGELWRRLPARLQRWRRAQPR